MTLEINRRGSTLAFIIKSAFAIMILCGIGWTALAIAGSLMKTEQPAAMTHRVARGDLIVTVNEQGVIESAENTEVKSKVRGHNAVLWIIDSGSFVKKGDELVRLDALFIQEQVDERTKYSNWSQSAADNSLAQVARSKIAVQEYDQGRYQSEVMTMEKDVAIAKAAVQSAKDRGRHTRAMASSGYISELELEERQFAIQQAELNLQLKTTQLDVLKNYTYKEQLQTLKGEFASVTATHKANVERAMADKSRRDRAVDELQYCVIRAPRDGLVIHPNAAKWESGPIAEGTNVHKNQVLLLMPDLQRMQVKVGVHEAVVKRVKNGQHVKVAIPQRNLEGEVTDVASITKPAGWWTGNQVRYDTIVTLPSVTGLRPGTSANVEIVVAEYKDVLLIPVAAIVEREGKHFCWIQTPAGAKRQPIKIGDSNDIFTIVKQGIEQGAEVLLNPAAHEAPIADEGNLQNETDADENKEVQPQNP